MEEQICQSQFISQKKEFYEDAAKYWDKIPATIDGMLGGYGFLSRTDILGSTQFLKSLFELPGLLPERKYALDCGAGIGRITGNLLTKYFETVDLVEQNPKFLEQAKSYLKNSLSRVGQFYSAGLQDFCPEPGKYNIIWCQWVLSHINNKDLINFFKNCRQALKSTGLVIVKENVTSSNVVEVDNVDSSITRPYSELLNIFEKSGFECIKQEKQYNMPKGIYPVYMFAIKPCDN